MADELAVSNNESLTVPQRDALLERLKQAWNGLPPETKTAVSPLLDDGHEQLGALVETGKAPLPSTHVTLRLKSYLTGDWDGHLARLGQPLHQATAEPSPVAAQAIKIGPLGEILASGKYQHLDPLWELISGTVWLENLLHKHPFPTGTPSILPMDDDVTFALVSDFGTGNFGAGDSPSVKISKFIPSLEPDYTVHLGDVYYAGTGAEGASKLLSLWPSGAKGSFALNSNHDMYSGGGPYFKEIVGSNIFSELQSPYSFFALENTNWIVVGLDSAYFAAAHGLYMNGTLGKDNAQIAFLEQIAQRGKKVILLTHHNAIPVDGFEADKPLQLYTDVMNAFAGAPPPAYWYFGHEHMGAAYRALEGSGIRCRCLGHGALPWGFASALESAQSAGAVEWFERTNAADPYDPLRVHNGFVSLTLSGPELSESFYDENGQVAWTAGQP